MKNEKLAAFLLLLFSTTFASAFSIEFAGEKHPQLCACEVAALQLNLASEKNEEIVLSVSAGEGLEVISTRAVEVDKQTTTKNIFVAASCDSKPGLQSLQVKASDGSEEHALAGFVEIVQCDALELRPVSSKIECGESEYEFELQNKGTRVQKGFFETNLAENGLSQKEFILQPKEKTVVKAKAKGIAESDLRKQLVVTAVAEKTRATASAQLAKHCPTQQQATQPQQQAEQQVQQQQQLQGQQTGQLAQQLQQQQTTQPQQLQQPEIAAASIANISTGFFIAARQLPVQWLLLAVALLLIAGAYYVLRSLEEKQDEEDSRLLRR